MLSDSPERVMVLWVPELDEARLMADASDDAREDRERRWSHALLSIEQLVPGVESLRGGWCAMRARGPARYYGGETEAAEAVLTRVAELGFPDSRVGVANGRFAAEQAARAAESDPGVNSAGAEHLGPPAALASGARIVAPEHTARLLDPLPVSRAAGEELAEVLLSLGIRTLGALAALPETAVRERFGASGASAQRRARGLGPAYAAEVRPRTPPVDLTVRFACEPPLDGADQLAFACTTHAERLLRGLISRGLVCTELRVELTDDIGVRHERRWVHPGRFSAADVVNRVRWQADSVPRDPERGGSGIAAVLLTPVRTARAAEHEPGLWSTAPDERVHHHLSRVQSLLGHRGVGTGELTGGRLSADRQRLVPWGTGPRAGPQRVAGRGVASSTHRGMAARSRAGPWPGHLPGPAPNAVFTEPLQAALLDDAGAPVEIGSDLDDAASQTLSAHPARLRIDGKPLPAAVRAWSSLWPLRERWWAGAEDAQRSNTRPALPPQRPTEQSEGWAGAESAQRSNTRPALPPQRPTERSEGWAGDTDTARYRLQLLLDDGDAWLLRYETGRGWLAEARYV